MTSPILLEDTFGTADGMHTSAGSLALEEYIAPPDAAAISTKRLDSIRKPKGGTMRVLSRRSWVAVLAIGSLVVSTPVHGQKAPKKERNRISREELVQAAARYSTLYDAVRTLRPHFLQVNTRGVRTTGIGEGSGGAGVPGSMRSLGNGGSNALDARATVYLDGVRSGDPDILKSINTGTVDEVRYLTPTEAETELGPRNEGGAILVKTARAEKP